MDKELSSRLGYIQVVLKKLVDGEQRLLIQCINGILLEYFLQEHLTQGHWQLIDQAADAQVVIIDDGALRLKDLAHLNGHLRLFVDAA